MDDKQIEFTKPTFIKALSELSAYVASLDDGKTYTITVKEKKKARSLNANRYLWVMCQQLAEALGTTKLDIYQQAIRDIGVFRQVEINEKAVDTLIHSWKMHGDGWVADRVDYTENEGFVLVNLYYGSSTYNTKQMSRLIDNVVQDCKALDIETLSERELSLLKDSWEGCT
jgi:hypothetical protein